MRSKARGSWEVISTTIVAGTAIMMAYFYVQDRRESSPVSGSAQVFVEDWREWDDSAIRMGADDAIMVIAVFIDFTCPFCRDQVPVFDSLRKEFGQGVAIDIHQFPLLGHPFAGPAAAAADCAHRQGRFAAMYHTLYSQVDSFGSKAWGAFADDAGVRDVPAFEECILEPPTSFARITAGRALGNRLGVNGTPEVWVNGQLFLGRTLKAYREKARELGL